MFLHKKNRVFYMYFVFSILQMCFFKNKTFFLVVDACSIVYRTNVLACFSQNNLYEHKKSALKCKALFGINILCIQ